MEDVWTSTEPVSFLGLRLTTNMTVLQGNTGLLVCSPVPLTPERRAAVDSMGDVAHVYAPNTHHHLWIGDWARAFPSARLHAPEALKRKRPDLSIHRVHGEPPFDEAIEELPVEGFRLHESVLFHRPSKTLVVADLVHHIGRPEHGWTKLYTQMMGFYDRVAISRAIRMTAFSDRGAARRSIDAILERPLERVIVGHGAPVDRSALEEAYRWLR